MITKRDFILHGSYFCDEYMLPTYMYIVQYTMCDA